ncbi:hypothetical protein SDC9_101953 [bioreactor metagenome]|uniref:4Fe-4S ferredoxin-type domain-containing protein n=1 Tax=bioreactor metagenome TaxID=1076179 RepID=A0A645APY3_9ZZZZ|nr:molybdopterin-binding protein [Candidatus Metalachnospira sp.]
MKLINTTDAVGQVLCHDMTRIVKGEFKGAQFKKGHVVTKEDIPMFLSMGKEHIYVWEMQEGMVHENDAAKRLYNLCANDNIKPSEIIKEGKIEAFAQTDGYFEVDVNRLDEINSLDEIMIATRHGNTAVKAGDKLAGMRVIPLVVEDKKLKEAEEIYNGNPILKLTPYKLKTAGIITTGSEVFKGIIKDTFTPVVVEKLKIYGVETKEHIIVDDGMDNIVDAIKQLRTKNLDMILCTGGMSVDPDDNTPGAVKQSGAKIVTYGAPVLPGAMYLLAYFDDGTPIMGLPGCVMFAKATVFDLLLPKIAAGQTVSKKDVVKLGNGGLCLGCSECRYPICPFGK